MNHKNNSEKDDKMKIKKTNFVELGKSSQFIQNLIKYNLVWITALFRSGSPFKEINIKLILLLNILLYYILLFAKNLSAKNLFLLPLLYFLFLIQLLLL